MCYCVHSPFLQHKFTLASLCPALLCTLVVSKYKVLKYFKTVQTKSVFNGLNALNIFVSKKQQQHWAKKSLNLILNFFMFRREKSLNSDNQRKQLEEEEEREGGELLKAVCSAPWWGTLSPDRGGQLWTRRPHCLFLSWEVLVEQRLIIFTRKTSPYLRVPVSSRELLVSSGRQPLIRETGHRQSLACGFQSKL